MVTNSHTNIFPANVPVSIYQLIFVGYIPLFYCWGPGCVWIKIYDLLPSGKRLQQTMENHNF